MNFEFSDDFAKDLKRLSEKWRSLKDDIVFVKPRISSFYAGESEQELQEFRAAFFNSKRAAILTKNENYEVVKMRLDVESLGGSDKARIVFVAVIKSNQVTFIELFSKSEKNREDSRRIKSALKKL